MTARYFPWATLHLSPKCWPSTGESLSLWRPTTTALMSCPTLIPLLVRNLKLLKSFFFLPQHKLTRNAANLLAHNCQPQYPVDTEWHWDPIVHCASPVFIVTVPAKNTWIDWWHERQITHQERPTWCFLFLPYRSVPDPEGCPAGIWGEL